MKAVSFLRDVQLNIFIQWTCAGIAQSVQRLTTDWTVRGSNLGGGARFSAPVRTGPGAHSSSYTMHEYLLKITLSVHINKHLRLFSIYISNKNVTVITNNS